MVKEWVRGEANTKFIKASNINVFADELNKAFKDGWELVPNTLQSSVLDYYHSVHYMAVIQRKDIEEN